MFTTILTRETCFDSHVMIAAVIDLHFDVSDAVLARRRHLVLR